MDKHAEWCIASQETAKSTELSSSFKLSKEPTTEDTLSEFSPRIFFFTMGWHNFTTSSTNSTQKIFLTVSFSAIVDEIQPTPPPKSIPIPIIISQAFGIFLNISET